MVRNISIENHLSEELLKKNQFLDGKSKIKNGPFNHSIISYSIGGIEIIYSLFIIQLIN